MTSRPFAKRFDGLWREFRDLYWINPCATVIGEPVYTAISDVICLVLKQDATF